MGNTAFNTVWPINVSTAARAHPAGRGPYTPPTRRRASASDSDTTIANEQWMKLGADKHQHQHFHISFTRPENALMPSHPSSPALVYVPADVFAAPTAGADGDADDGSALAGDHCLLQLVIAGYATVYDRVNARAAIAACDGDRNVVRASQAGGGCTGAVAPGGGAWLLFEHFPDATVRAGGD